MQLAPGEGISGCLVGIIAVLEFDEYRRPRQVHSFPKIIGQITAVMRRSVAGLVAVDDDADGVVSSQVGILELDAPAPDQGRRICRQGIVQESGHR